MRRFIFRQHIQFIQRTLFGALVFLCAFFCTVFFNCTNVYGYDNIVIVIDAGHGGNSETGDETHSGAVYHGLEEKNINLITAEAMYDELTQYQNVTVYMTRDIDEEVTIDRRAEFASEVGANLLVSIHYNASSDHNFFGAEAFVSAFGDANGVGSALGQMCLDEWKEHGSIIKDVKTRIGKSGRDYYGLIRLCEEYGIPAIILEHGYLDNDKDFLRIKSEAAWRELGVADATAVAKFYGLEKDIVQENIEPTVDTSAPEEDVLPDESEPYDVELTIENYNSNKGDFDFTLTAKDDESKLMYYGFALGDDIDEDTVFYELEKWEGKKGKMQGTFHVQPGYEGLITAAVYNVYQLDTKSNSVELVPDEEIPDDEEDNAIIPVVEEDGSEGDLMQEGENPSDSAKDDNSWMIGGTSPETVFTARANAIDKNTESTVKKSYVGFIIAGLIAGMAVAVLIVLGVTSANRKRRRRKRINSEGGARKSYDWMDD